MKVASKILFNKFYSHQIRIFSTVTEVSFYALIKLQNNQVKPPKKETKYNLRKEQCIK